MVFFFTLISDDRRRPHLNECIPHTRLNNSGVLGEISAKLRSSVLLAAVSCSGVPFTVNDMPINTKSNIVTITKCLPFIFVNMCTVLKLVVQERLVRRLRCDLESNWSFIERTVPFYSFSSASSASADNSRVIIGAFMCLTVGGVPIRDSKVPCLNGGNYGLN